MRIEVTNDVTKFHPESPEEEITLLRIKTKYSLMAPGAQYSPSYKLYVKTRGKQGWNGRVYLLSVEKEILSGLLPDFVSALISENIDCHIIDKRKRIPIVRYPTSVKLRDYQYEAIESFLTHSILDMPWHRGIFHMATGSGKTETAVAITQILNLPTMFIVNKKDLLQQASDRYKKYGTIPGVIGAGIFEPDDHLNIVTAQTIFNSKAKNPGKYARIYQFIQKTQFVIWDEAHMLAAKMDRANIFAELAKYFPNAFFRLGLTATPFMRDEYSNQLLKGATGSVLYSISSKDLIDKNILSPPKIHIIKYPTDTLSRDISWEWADMYRMGIVLNTNRTKKTIDLALKAKKPCLVLVKQLEHGELIYFGLAKKGIKTEYLTGSDSKEERLEVLDQFKNGEIEVLVSTTIFDEGVDIPNLASIIIASGGTSKIKAIQRVGRGLRRTNRKTTVSVFDFWDEAHPLLTKHSKSRLKVYKEEGFEIVHLDSSDTDKSS